MQERRASCSTRSCSASTYLQVWSSFPSSLSLLDLGPWARSASFVVLRRRCLVQRLADVSPGNLGLERNEGNEDSGDCSGQTEAKAGCENAVHGGTSMAVLTWASSRAVSRTTLATTMTVPIELDYILSRSPTQPNHSRNLDSL